MNVKCGLEWGRVKGEGDGGRILSNIENTETLFILENKKK
jgi:hypothetical protein